jgi:hypothetical protein
MVSAPQAAVEFTHESVHSANWLRSCETAELHEKRLSSLGHGALDLDAAAFGSASAGTPDKG